MNTTLTAYTKMNTKLTLSLIASGGEGSVYSIVGYPKKVAKIYHDSDSAEAMSKREQKVDAMLDMRNSQIFQSVGLGTNIAWPLGGLYADEQHKKFIGFGMDRISASTELDELYSYPVKDSCTITIKDKIACLLSICDVIERIHLAGQVFGDFNPNNIKVNPDFSVSFVDADSYHIINSGKTYKCIACAPGYVAPEVIRACKGSTYAECAETTFTQSSDLFSLAIHIFRMLMNGCHPYSIERQNRPIGSAPAPKPIDKQVEDGKTPFFMSIPNFRAPSYAPEINALPPYIRALFFRAFVDGHSNPTARPTIQEWKNALNRYQANIIQCKDNRTHYYWRETVACPYCAAELRFKAKCNSNVSVKQHNASNKQINYKRPTASLPNNSAKVNVVYNGNTYHSKPGAVNTPYVATSKTTISLSDKIYWIITMAASITVQILLAINVLPGIYNSLFGDNALAAVGIVGSTIAGIVGCGFYNGLWSHWANYSKQSWWDYILSVLVSVGFTIGFGVLLGIVILIISLFLYLFAAIAIVGIIIAALSGG